MWAAIVNSLLGVWLMVAPWLLSLDKTSADTYYIVGPIVLTFAITALWEVNRSARYGTLLCGVWMVLSPFVLPVQDAFATWITVAAGVLLILFSCIKGKIKGSYGGGWRSLFQKHPLHMTHKP